MQYYTEYELSTGRRQSEPLLNLELERRRIAEERRGEAGARATSGGVFARLAAWATGNRRGRAVPAEQASTGPLPN